MEWLVIILVIVAAFALTVMLRAALGPDYDKEPEDHIDELLDDKDG